MRQNSCQLNNTELMTKQRQKLSSVSDSLCPGIYEWNRQNRIVVRLDPRPLLLIPEVSM